MGKCLSVMFRRQLPESYSPYDGWSVILFEKLFTENVTLFRGLY